MKILFIIIILTLYSCSFFSIKPEVKKKLIASNLLGTWEKTNLRGEIVASMGIYYSGAANIYTPNFKVKGGAIGNINSKYFTIKPNVFSVKYFYKIFQKDNETYIAISNKSDNAFVYIVKGMNDFFECFKDICKDLDTVVLKKLN